MDRRHKQTQTNKNTLVSLTSKSYHRQRATHLRRRHRASLRRRCVLASHRLRRTRTHHTIHAATKHLVAKDHCNRLPWARQDSTCSRRTKKRQNISETDEETRHPAYTAHRQECRFITIGMQRRR
ncbi:hypothetical protein EVAR_88338_1 [Eumeta japonica]|uniref:Uncharacterized protein n=1 Tax=Eumeta variegata TaxID=151549 RepID=A0A4C1YC25_EUMVA|nr:hypothetical protein EVAR_88338_1 [Eumeta japonica]